MINHLRVSKGGFTLLETIIYVALFTLLFTGVLASSYSFFTGAEYISAMVVQENESAFVVQKMTSLLTSANAISQPSSGNTGSVVTFTTYEGAQYTFALDSGAITYGTNGGVAEPLTAERTTFSNFTAAHTPATSKLPRYLEYSFIVNGKQVGPLRTYFTF